MDYKYIIDGFFRNYYGSDNSKTPTCTSNDYTPYVDIAYLNTPVNGVTNELLSQSIASVKARKIVSQFLMKYEDDRISGFDGALLYSVRNDTLEIYTFSLGDYNKLYVEEVNLRDLVKHKALGMAICKSLPSRILPSSP